MAKSVDLDMLARVTGAKKQVATAQVPTPPAPPAAAAGLAPGFKGKLPIPKNVPVFTPDPKNLTDEERLALQSIQWQPGEQITGDVSDLIAAVRREEDQSKQDEFARLAALDPTNVGIKATDISELSPEKAAAVKRKMQETIEANRMAQEEKVAAESAIGMPDSVRDAIREARKPHGIEVEDDRAATPAATAPAGSTGLIATHPGNCPHCGWDLGEPDDVPVSEADKITFLHSVLGEKSFVKDYPLFGGAVTATFRSLTGGEIDKVYAQVFHEQKKGEIGSGMDFHERVNRYRLYLQLVGLKSNSFHHEFPDGFTPETNDTAQSHYSLPTNLPDGETGLRAVEAYVTGTALKHEIVVRTVTNECRRFNRLVSKLEAVADHPDFWEATGGAP